MCCLLGGSCSLSCAVGLATLTTDLATIVLGEATPDARVLVRHKCVFKALDLYGAGVTHSLCIGDVCNCWSRLADRKEQIRIGISACGASAPHAGFSRFLGRENYCTV